MTDFYEQEKARFRPVYRELSDDEKAAAYRIKNTATALAVEIQNIKGGAPSREKSVAITKLEESIMWAIKGLTACAIFALAAIPGDALASGNTCIGNANCSTTNNDNDTTNNNSSAAASASASATGGQGGKGGDAKQAQGQEQGQLQGQIQGQGQGQLQGQSVSKSGNSSVSIYNPRDPVATATAGGYGSKCTSGVGLGLQFLNVGGSVSIPITDGLCEGLAACAELRASGYADACVRVLCLKDDDVAQAVGEAVCAGQSMPAALPPPAPAYEPMTPVPN